MSREPLRAQSAPTTEIASRPPQTPAAWGVQAESKAPVAFEHGTPKYQALTRPIAPPSMPIVEASRTQPEYTAPAVASVQYHQHGDGPPERAQQPSDELLEQAQAAEASVQVQAQLLSSGIDYDQSAAASDAFEQAQQFEFTAPQDDVPQQ